MVEDNREDESVRKLADAICNQKEIVEEDVSKGPDKVNLEHEHFAVNAPSKRSKTGNGQRKVSKTKQANVKGYVEDNRAFVDVTLLSTEKVDILYHWKQLASNQVKHSDVL
ncbi:hypothetical protein M9H77_35225 [Catharanthus roseus]|uniref:Uncharacterized protein n=1 Tax=Catharanthus roseus TaxID=4058 RepID=A0ACB9ZNN8_CATRO|nr:hypothetical protein M9H77_35225 [Catharanthus roseus]